jgi:hypothetical protein
MKTSLPAARISPADLKRLKVHLRRTLGCAKLAVNALADRGTGAELLVGAEVVGTVDQVHDEGKRSWTVTMVILEDDLAE